MNYTPYKPEEKCSLVIALINKSEFNFSFNDHTKKVEIETIVEMQGFISDEVSKELKKIVYSSILGKIDGIFNDKFTLPKLKNVLRFSEYLTLGYESKRAVSNNHYQLIFIGKYLRQFKSLDKFLLEIDKLDKAGIPIRKLIEDEPKYYFGYAVYPLFENLSPSDFTSDNIANLRQLCEFISDNLVKKSLLNYIDKQEIKNKEYDERVDLLFKRIQSKIAGFKELYEISENEVCTEEEFRKFKEGFEENLSNIYNLSSEGLGKTAILSLLNPGSQKAALDAAKTLIGKKANGEIRELIVSILVKEYEGSDDTSIPLSLMSNLESSIFSIDDNYRRGILVRLLAGKNGLISNTGEYRSHFLSFLLEDVLKEGKDDDLASMLDDVISGSKNVKTWKPLFFALQNLLVDYTVKPSNWVSSWADILYGVGSHSEDESKVPEVGVLKKANVYKRLNEIQKNKDLFPWRFKHDFSEGVNLKVLDLLEKEGEIDETREFIELEVLDLILEVCQSVGSLGVRFLQLFPLFTNLKPEYRDKFSKAFDKVDGQSRFVAIMTLDDNWENFWDDVEYIYPGRVGGGSINTVLKLKMKDDAYHPEFSGKTLTVKVRNPNLEFHLEETKKMLDEAIDELIAIDPKYKIAKLIIDDVYLWIKNELNYKNYVEKDKDFHKNLAEFNDNNSGIEFITPETYTVPLKEGISDTNQIIVEDFIESDQITDGFSNLKEKGYEMKDVVSNMARNYCFQLAKGFANSDVSIGNYLLAKGEEDETLIAVIDKLYFLEFDDNIKDNLKPIITLLQVLSEDPKKYATKIRENLNLSISDATIGEIEEHLIKLKDEFKDGSFTLSKVKEVFTDIVKLIPELDKLISKVSNQDVILKDSEDFVRDSFSIFNQKISENDVSTLSKELNEARSALVTNGSADGILSFAKKIVNQVNLNQETKELLEMLIGMYAFSVKSDADKINTLNQVVTNKEFASTLATKQSVKSVFEGAKERFKEDDFSGTLDVFHKLRDIGLIFDIRITLALKNIFALHQMAIDAGFKNGFFEALCHRKED